MATNFWICYEGGCNHRATTKEFEHPEGGHACPKCKSPDGAFPWRKFRCLGCGHEAEQGPFFIFFPGGSRSARDHKQFEADLDADPLEEKWEYDCSHANNRNCSSKSYAQIDDGSIAPIVMSSASAGQVEEELGGQLALPFDRSP